MVVGVKMRDPRGGGGDEGGEAGGRMSTTEVQVDVCDVGRSELRITAGVSRRFACRPPAYCTALQLLSREHVLFCTIPVCKWCRIAKVGKENTRHFGFDEAFVFHCPGLSQSLLGAIFGVNHD
jgi:hypothetical protein